LTRQAARGTLGCVEGVALDGLVTRLLALSPFDYRVVGDQLGDGQRVDSQLVKGR
jgi:hypothetical protein